MDVKTIKDLSLLNTTLKRIGGGMNNRESKYPTQNQKVIKINNSTGIGKNSNSSDF